MRAEPSVGGESHFLGGCGQGCSDGLSCLAGVCSRACSDAPLDCSDLAASASCRPGATASNQALCDLECVNDASCASVGVGLECQGGFCRAVPRGSSGVLTSGDPGGAIDTRDPWWCLGKEPPALPDVRLVSRAPGELESLTVGFVLPVVEWNTRTPLAGRGLTATLCSSLDVSCSPPLAPPYLVADGPLGMAQLPPGAAGVPVPEGFDGFIEFDVVTPPDTPADQQFVPLAYVLGGAISGDLSQGMPILMLQRRVLTSVVELSFPGTDAELALARGIVEVGAYDCNGAAASDVRVELEIDGESAPGALPFLMPSSRIPIAQPVDQPLYTQYSGLAGYLSVPPGTVQLTAYRGGDTEPFGSLQMAVVAGQISQGPIRPPYFRDANLVPSNDVSAP